MTGRIERLRERLTLDDKTCAVVSREVNLFYLTGFTGSSAVLYVDGQQAVLLTDFRYLQQAKSQVPAGVRVLDHESRVADILRSLLPGDMRRAGFESKDSHLFWKTLRAMARPAGVRLFELDDALLDMRTRKDPGEVEQIRRAAAIADEAFGFLLEEIRPGMTENHLALALEFFMRQKGASGLSFPTIMASGSRSALPHGTSSDKIIEFGDLLVMDYGCVVNRYCSDMTRTVAVGDITSRQQAVYETVLEAQEEALLLVRPGISVRELDARARQVIDGAGYGPFFGHALGHGVGLEIHELPAVSSRTGTILEEGMVITIEPGVYLEGSGGVRIEDLVLVTATGGERLSRSPKELVIL